MKVGFISGFSFKEVCQTTCQSHVYAHLSFTLLSIDPIVYIAHAVNDYALHERHVRMDRSMGLTLRTALYRDGESVCAVVHFMCDLLSPPPLS